MDLFYYSLMGLGMVGICFWIVKEVEKIYKDPREYEAELKKKALKS